MSIELHEHAVRPGRNVRLDTLVRLRWVAVIGQTTAVLVVYFGLDFELPIWACLAVIILAAWLNVALRVRFRVTQRIEPDRAAWLLAFDIAEIAILLFLTGGLQNPCSRLASSRCMRGNCPRNRASSPTRSQLPSWCWRASSTYPSSTGSLRQPRT